MTINAENGQNAAAVVEDINAVTNVVQNYIPRDWFAKTLPDPFKYASVVKQIFIMNAGVTVKMKRTMDVAQRNLNTLLQCTDWVENLEMCYDGDVIAKYLRYTTKTMRKDYSGHDVSRKFCDGLQVFQNTFTPIWNAVLAAGISGKTWPEVWMIFVDKLTANEGPVTAENLVNAEFKTAWLLAYKFLGPHLGIVAASSALWESLHPDKLAPSTEQVPERFELGTLPYELLAGLIAAVDVLADLVPGGETSMTRRDRLVRSMTALAEHEDRLHARLRSALEDLPGITVYANARRRTPTEFFTIDGWDSAELARRLADKQINAPADSFYAYEPCRSLGLGSGGAIRAGLAPYTDETDVDRLIAALRDIVIA